MILYHFPGKTKEKSHRLLLFSCFMLQEGFDGSFPIHQSDDPDSRAAFAGLVDGRQTGVPPGLFLTIFPVHAIRRLPVREDLTNIRCHKNWRQVIWHGVSDAAVAGAGDLTASNHIPRGDVMPCSRNARFSSTVAGTSSSVIAASTRQ